MRHLAYFAPLVLVLAREAALALPQEAVEALLSIGGKDGQRRQQPAGLTFLDVRDTLMTSDGVSAPAVRAVLTACAAAFPAPASSTADADVDPATSTSGGGGGGGWCALPSSRPPSGEKVAISEQELPVEPDRFAAARAQRMAFWGRAEPPAAGALPPEPEQPPQGRPPRAPPQALAQSPQAPPQAPPQASPQAPALPQAPHRLQTYAFVLAVHLQRESRAASAVVREAVLSRLRLHGPDTFVCLVEQNVGAALARLVADLRDAVPRPERLLLVSGTRSHELSAYAHGVRAVRAATAGGDGGGGSSSSSSSSSSSP